MFNESNKQDALKMLAFAVFLLWLKMFITGLMTGAA